MTAAALAGAALAGAALAGATLAGATLAVVAFAGVAFAGVAFAGLAFASVMATVVVALPPAPFWNNQAAYEVAFGSTWRIVAASMFAYFCGEFVNSFTLAKLKISASGLRKILDKLLDHADIYREEGGFILSKPLLMHYLKDWRL